MYILWKLSVELELWVSNSMPVKPRCSESFTVPYGIFLIHFIHFYHRVENILWHFNLLRSYFGRALLLYNLILVYSETDFLSEFHWLFTLHHYYIRDLWKERKRVCLSKAWTNVTYMYFPCWRINYNPGQKCWDTCTFSLKIAPLRFPPPPSPSQCCISGLKVHFFGATLTRGEGGRHFAQTRPSRASKTEQLANACHIFRLSQGLVQDCRLMLEKRQWLSQWAQVVHQCKCTMLQPFHSQAQKVHSPNLLNRNVQVR